MKVAVLSGGRSLERVVSLRSGARVEDALGGLGHEPLMLDADHDLVRILKAERPDAAFVAMHGPGGEDGTVQELLEILKIPYTGPGVASCMRCMDKALTKHELRAAGVPTPDWAAFTGPAFRSMGAADALVEIEEQLGMPLIVKPAGQGSSLGVKLVDRRADLPNALISALSYDERVLLERSVQGRELAIAVLDGEALPIVEALPKGGQFDFEARYEIGRTDYICPADLGEAEAACREAALRAWEVLDCAGFVRVDLMLDDEGPQVLEVNAVPGLTDTSLVPLAAEAAGMSFERFVERALELALARAGAERHGVG